MRQLIVRFLNVAVIAAVLIGYNTVLDKRDKEDQIARLSAELETTQLQKENLQAAAAASNTADTAASEAAEAEGQYVDGTYDGEADGFGGTIAVEVTVEGGQITDLAITSADGEGVIFMISVKNLKKTYLLGGEEVHALDDVSLLIKEHEFVAIIGQSGSGKSTFMNMLGCLDRPDSGEITLDGTDILKCKEKELSVIRNKKIGFIFQQFHLLPKLSALENVELPLIYQGMPTKKRREKAVKALKAVGLEKRMNHKPNQLSGGQQQRVAIARALVGEPSLILADEPTGNLDSRSGKEIMMLLHNLHEEGNTIVLITHDNNVAMEAPRQVQISDGKIIKDSGGEAEYEDHTSN